MLKSETFTIKSLDSESIPLMDGMLTVFGEAFDEVETYSAKRPGAKYLAQLLGNDNFLALVAIIEVVGVGGTHDRKVSPVECCDLNDVETLRGRDY